MQRKYGWLAATSLVLAAAAPLSASAEERSGFYFGGTFGQASYDVKQSDFDEVMILAIEEAGGDVLDGDSDLDKKDSSFSVFAGYRFNDYFAVEAAYLDLGKADYEAVGDVFVPGLGTLALDGSISVESQGPALSGIGILPLTEAFDLYARVGVFFSDTKIKIGLSSGSVSESDSLSGKDEDLFYGLGANWNITQNWALRLEYQLFEKVGKKSETGQGDIDALTLAILFNL